MGVIYSHDIITVNSKNLDAGEMLQDKNLHSGNLFRVFNT